jgi:hypothetical protein
MIRPFTSVFRTPKAAVKYSISLTLPEAELRLRRFPVAHQVTPLGFSTITTTKGNMKKLIGYVSVVAVAGMLAGCVGPMGPMGSTGGSIYTDVSGPVLATSQTGASKVGTASSMGILGIATGDSSIKAASDSAGITKIQHVDYHVMNVLGVYGKTTVTVYGE